MEPSQNTVRLPYSAKQIEQWFNNGKNALVAWQSLLNTILDERWLDSSEVTEIHLARVNIFVSTLDPLRYFVQQDIGGNICDTATSIIPEYPRNKMVMQFKGMEYLRFVLLTIESAYKEAGIKLFDQLNDTETLKELWSHFFCCYGFCFAETFRESVIKSINSELAETAEHLNLIEVEKQEAVEWLVKNDTKSDTTGKSKKKHLWNSDAQRCLEKWLNDLKTDPTTSQKDALNAYVEDNPEVSFNTLKQRFSQNQDRWKEDVSRAKQKTKDSEK